MREINQQWRLLERKEENQKNPESKSELMTTKSTAQGIGLNKDQMPV